MSDLRTVGGLHRLADCPTINRIRGGSIGAVKAIKSDKQSFTHSLEGNGPAKRKNKNFAACILTLIVQVFCEVANAWSFVINAFMNLASKL